MPSPRKMTTTVSTATGRRRALFSPVPAMNGRAKSRAIPTMGATRMRKVSR
jgi:hypothetical protein